MKWNVAPVMQDNWSHLFCLKMNNLRLYYASDGLTMVGILFDFLMSLLKTIFVLSLKESRKCVQGNPWLNHKPDCRLRNRKKSVLILTVWPGSVRPCRNTSILVPYPEF